MSDLFPAKAVEIKGIGKLHPLNLAQIAEMQAAICRFATEYATGDIPSDQISQASSAIALQAIGMTFLDQAKFIINSGYLTGQAVAMMAGKQWAPLQTAAKINPKDLPAIHRAILSSYGIEIGGPDTGGEQSEGESSEATDSNASAERSPPSTDGAQNGSQG
jgi:hypothetical protein